MSSPEKNAMDLESVRGLMVGEDCLIVGCGPSATRAPHHVYASRWTFGCNRSVNFCAPDFAICVEPEGDHDVWHYVERAAPFLFFTHQKNRPRGLARRRTVEFDSKRPIEDVLGVDAKELRVGMSPWYALILATHLGFERVGLLGVDLLERRFQAAGFFNAANNGLGTVAKIANDRGAKVFNLSTASKVTSLERGSLRVIRPKGIEQEVSSWER